ncbi:hypothetical protein ES702_00130 [subsurface metagenome]
MVTFISHLRQSYFHHCRLYVALCSVISLFDVYLLLSPSVLLQLNLYLLDALTTMAGRIPGTPDAVTSVNFHTDWC